MSFSQEHAFSRSIAACIVCSHEGSEACWPSRTAAPVLLNLLTNALNASPQGSRVTLTRPSARALARATRRSGTGFIRISGRISSAFSACRLPTPLRTRAADWSCDLPQHHFSSRGTFGPKRRPMARLEHGFPDTAQTPQDVAESAPSPLLHDAAEV